MAENHPVGSATRALETLRSWLTPNQLQCFEKMNYIPVTGNHTGHTYHIGTNGVVNNVVCQKDGISYCCYPRNSYELPHADIWLAQALSITTDEESWLRVAISRNPIRQNHFPF